MKWICLIFILTSCSSSQQGRDIATSQERVLQISEKTIQLSPLTCHGWKPKREGCSVALVRLKTMLNGGSFIGIKINDTYYGAIEEINQKKYLFIRSREGDELFKTRRWNQEGEAPRLTLYYSSEE